MERTLQATIIQSTQTILVAIDNNAQLIRETQQEVQQTRAEVLKNRELIQDVSDQVAAVATQLSSLRDESTAFLAKFESGGTGWDTDGNGQASASELLDIMVDLGFVDAAPSARRSLQTVDVLATLELAASAFPVARSLYTAWQVQRESTPWNGLLSSTSNVPGVSIGQLLVEQLPIGHLADQAQGLLDQFAGGLLVAQSTAAAVWQAIETCASDIVRSTVDFLECMGDAPALPSSSCIAQLADGARNCIDPAVPCTVTLGGPQSSCLALDIPAAAFSVVAGPLTVSGAARPTATMEATAEFETMDFGVTLTNAAFDIAFDSSLDLSGNSVVGFGPEELLLTDTNSDGNIQACAQPTGSSCKPVSIFSRTFMVGIMPLIVELELQLVATVEILANSSCPVLAQYSYSERVGLDSATASNTNGLNIQWRELAPVMNQSFFASTVGSARIDLKVSVGPRLSLKLNGVGAAITPYAQLLAAGDLAFSASSCQSNSINTELGLGASLSFSGLESPGAGASTACQTGVCGLIAQVPGKVADCGWQALSGQDTTACEAATDVCEDMGDTLDNFVGVERSVLNPESEPTAVADCTSAHAV